MFFSAAQAASALWDYGEDDLVAPARALDERQLQRAWALASQYWDPTFQLPTARRVTMNLVMAFSVVTLLEGELRPLARDRLRPQSTKPEKLRNPSPVPPPQLFEVIRSTRDHGGRSFLRRLRRPNRRQELRPHEHLGAARARQTTWL